MGMQVREEVKSLQQRMANGLDALAGAALGNASFTAQHLEDILPLVMPLLGSPLVGEGAAFEAVHALAQCLPGTIGQHGLAVARSLRVVELSKQGVQRDQFWSAYHNLTFIVRSSPIYALQQMQMIVKRFALIFYCEVTVELAGSCRG
jgi:hypothetical protein